VQYTHTYKVYTNVHNKTQVCNKRSYYGINDSMSTVVKDFLNADRDVKLIRCVAEAIIFILDRDQ